MKIYSERFFIKYLFSNRGICLGVDLKDRSYLFLICTRGIILRKRNRGDRVVEDLDYEIDRIYNTIAGKEEGMKK
ncbi:hypothetical protein OXIME_001110 [Oxyplasma meridianum]|uniref:Uncharacterized protein n=1 Tax=Oxyplasma meridianum TaxID=3073602 RepID=A0AAX4NHQ5_9ARCH